jgi:hypothetical protein
LHRVQTNTSREAEERLVDFKQLQISDEQRHRDRVDGFKMYFELLKQVTTLATGSAILVATLVDRLFHEPKAKLLVAVSLCGFLVALGFAVFGMAGYAAKVRFSNPRSYEDVRDMGSTRSGVALVGFVAGVASLALFAVLNMVL